MVKYGGLADTYQPVLSAVRLWCVDHGGCATQPVILMTWALQRWLCAAAAAQGGPPSVGEGGERTDLTDEPVRCELGRYLVYSGSVDVSMR